jgi:uncharacterized protein YecT (DUF1311 family)
MKWLVSFFFALGVVLWVSAQEPEVTPQQAKAHFEKADKALNEAWAALKKKLPEEDFAKLKEEQRLWVEHRDYMALSPMYAGGSGDTEITTKSPEYLEAAAGLAETRTEFLKALAKADPNDVSLTGEWSDSYGGHVRMVEEEGRFYFDMSCGRGPTIHTGSIAGIATWNTPIGWFEVKEDEKPTNLSFILRGAKLEIIGANTQMFHGARAYFDGVYVKVANLTAKEQAEVKQTGKEGVNLEEE